MQNTRSNILSEGPLDLSFSVYGQYTNLFMLRFVFQHCLHSTLRLLFMSNTLLSTKGLLTECEVCRGKYLPEVFVQTERRRSEVCAKKNEGKYFPVQTEQTRLIRHLLYYIHVAFGSFSSLFIALCSSKIVFRCCRLPYL